MSSSLIILRRVVRGESASCCGPLVGTGIIGCAEERGISAIGFNPWLFFFIIRGPASSESGEAARDGPFGEVVLDRNNAGVDRDVFAAAWARAVARSFWWSIVVMSDRREVKTGLESTRWKKVFSSMLGFPPSSTESSQSDESSSSSIALSSISSSSSVSKTSSLRADDSSWMVRDAISSLNEVCFLTTGGRVKPLGTSFAMLCGNELSSSLDDPPKEKTAFFFLGRIGCKLCCSIALVCSLKESSPEDPPRANMACFFVFVTAISSLEGAVTRGTVLNEELTCDGENPLTMLVVLRSESPLAPSEVVCEECSEAQSEAIEHSTGVEGFDVSSVIIFGVFESSANGTNTDSMTGEALVGDSGSKTFFSLMVNTIFSRSWGVICLSRPRLSRLLIESVLELCMSRGAHVTSELLSDSKSIASSWYSRESTLPDKLGTSSGDCASKLRAEAVMAGDATAISDLGSQQNTSLLHSLQLKFSYLGPPSIEPEHLERTTGIISTQ